MDNLHLELPEYDVLKDVNITIMDTLINDLLDSGLDLPIISIVNSIYKAGRECKEYLFKKKLINFLKEASKSNSDKSEEFIQKIKSKGQYGKVGMSLLSMIDHLDEPDKATLTGKLYCYVVNNAIETDIFFRSCHIIDKCYYQDILELYHFKTVQTITSKNQFVKTEILENLFSVGFLSDRGYDGGGFTDKDDEGTIYSLSEYGKIILNII